MADESASDAFRHFIASYEGEGARLAVRFIRALAPNPEAPESYPNIRNLIFTEVLDEAEKASQALDAPEAEAFIRASP
jgi:hypothetical protein